MIASVIFCLSNLKAMKSYEQVPHLLMGSGCIPSTDGSRIEPRICTPCRQTMNTKEFEHIMRLISLLDTGRWHNSQRVLLTQAHNKLVSILGLECSYSLTKLRTGRTHLGRYRTTSPILVYYWYPALPGKVTRISIFYRSS